MQGVCVCGSSVGGACQPPPPHTPQTQTLAGSAHTHLSVDQQQHSQATLSLRESLSLSRHHLIYTSTLTHTHTHRTLLQAIFPYLSLFSCHETVSLRARNAVSSTVSQSVCIARCFCYGQASTFSTNIALGRMRETHVI